MASTQTEIQYKTLLEVEYGCRLHLLHERLFRRIKGFLLGANIFFGTAAFATVVSPTSKMAAWFGLFVAVASVLDLVVSPGDRAQKHDQLWGAFSKLRTIGEGLEVQDLCRKVKELQALPCQELESLRSVAYNDVMRQVGREDNLMRESLLPKFMRVLA